MRANFNRRLIAMQLKIDRKADALYLSLTEAPAARSEKMSPGLVVDYDAEDGVIGLEVLYLSKQARYRVESAPVRIQPVINCVSKETARRATLLISSRQPVTACSGLFGDACGSKPPRTGQPKRLTDRRPKGERAYRSAQELIRQCH